MGSFALSLRTALLALCACGKSAPEEDAATPVCEGVIVGTSDYTSSGVGSVPLDGAAPTFAFGPELGADPALAMSAGRTFFIARDRDTIFELDACGKNKGSFPARMPGDPPNANPQDVAVASDGALWIARYLVPSVLVVDGTTRSPIGAIDLSSLDPDKNPNQSSIRIKDQKAFVTLGLLDDTKPVPASSATSIIAVIDVASRTLETTFTLPGRNPFGTMREADDGSFIIAAAGNFSKDDEVDAGIVRVLPNERRAELIVSEPTLGGTVVEVSVSGQCAAVILADATAENRTSLILYDLAAKTTFVVVPKTAGFDLQGLLWRSDTLLLGQRTPKQIRQFRRSGACMVGGDTSAPTPLPPIGFR